MTLAGAAGVTTSVSTLVSSSPFNNLFINKPPAVVIARVITPIIAF